jgi:hypothetical protein
MKFWRSSLLLFAAAGAVRAADTPVANLLPPKTSVVFGVRVRPLLDALEAQGVLKDLREQTKPLLSQGAFSGFDLFQDVDELLVASTGGNQDAPALIIVTGRFHVVNPGIVESQKGSKQVLAFLNDSTLLAGDLALVKAALRSGDGESRNASALADRIAAMRAQYTVWGFADKLDTKSKQAGDIPKELQSIDGFSFGAGMTHGLELAAELHVRNPQDVEKLSSLLHGWEQMLKLSSPAGSDAKLDVQTTSDTVKLAIHVSEEEIKRAVAAQRQAAPAPKPEIRTPQEIVSDPNGNTLRITLPGKSGGH